MDAQLRDFVDRIEVIYVWSQLLRDPNADLPGREVIGNCSLPENTKFAQLIFGGVTATSNGNASTQMAALLNNQHPYLAAGDTDIVGLCGLPDDVVRAERQCHRCWRERKD